MTMIRPVLGIAASGLTLIAAPASAQDIGGPPAAPADTRMSATPSVTDTRLVALQPYIEVAQTVFAELSPGDDTVTFTTLAAGIDGFVATRNTQGQISARYERRIAWGENNFDDDILSGIGRVSVGVGRTLTLEAGGFAARTRTFGGGPFLDFGGNNQGVSNLYSVFAGPRFATQTSALDIEGGYRFGYTKLTQPNIPSPIAGQPAFDVFDDSSIHLADLTIGSTPGRTLPFGWALSGAYVREDVGVLDQRYQGWFVRGDVTVPMSQTLAVVGGVGWEDIESSSRAPVRDATGAPVVGNDGRLVTDPNSPRLVAFATDALFWDVGVLWRPSARTSLEVRAGERYESFTAFGNLNWQFGRQAVLSIVVYDTVDSFGRRLTGALDDLPTRFRTGRNGFGGGFNGCVFGVEEGAAGQCLTGALGAIANADYRSRGVDLLVGNQWGRWSYGAGVGYANRDYFAPDIPGVTLFGIEDQTAYMQAFLGYQLSPRSSLDGQFFTTWYDAGFGTGDLWSTGALGIYNYSFGRIDAQATLGYQGFRQDGFDSSSSATAQLGVRYNF